MIQNLNTENIHPEAKFEPDAARHQIDALIDSVDLIFNFAKTQFAPTLYCVIKNEKAKL